MMIGDPILFGSGGGIPCTLTITTSPGATVTATLENKIVSAVANESGIATLLLEEEGIWTVIANNNNTTASMTVNINLEKTEKFMLYITNSKEGFV